MMVFLRDGNGNEIREAPCKGSPVLAHYSIRLPALNKGRQIGHTRMTKGTLIYHKNGMHYLVEGKAFCMPKMLIDHLVGKDKNAWIHIECKTVNLYQRAKEFYTGITVLHDGYEEQWGLNPEEFIQREK